MLYRHHIARDAVDLRDRDAVTVGVLHAEAGVVVFRCVLLFVFFCKAERFILILPYRLIPELIQGGFYLDDRCFHPSHK